MSDEDLNQDVEDLVALKKEFLRLQFRILERLIPITTKIKKEGYEEGDLCDLGWVSREFVRAADELRKEMLARQELAGRLLAFRVTQRFVSDPDSFKDSDLTVRGRYSSGSPDVSQSSAVPKRGTKEYRELCAHFGINEDTIEKEVVDFSYPRLAAYISDRVASGVKLPQGITRTFPVYKTTFRTNDQRSKKKRRKN